MKVSELGELQLIKLLAELVDKSHDLQPQSWKNLIIGIGDDSAAWNVETPVQLATVDSFVQDVHFSRDYATWEELGWKALAINLSDIAAMGGVPRYALVSLALPSDTNVDDVVALYQGMLKLARQFEVAIIGGNVTNAFQLTITITVLGITSSQNQAVLTRMSAIPGDKIAVTGHLGAAAAGAEMLSKQLKFDPKTTTCLKKAFLHPYPRINEGKLLIAHGVKSAIDISDGLLSDLNHICKSSRVGARIEVDQLPIHPCVKTQFRDNALQLALSGGEDYELLFSADAEVINKITARASILITVIGEITADNTCKTIIVDSRGKSPNILRTGWNHFVKE